MVVYVANGNVDIAQGAEQAIVGLARAWRGGGGEWWKKKRV